ncbi:MAG TPA: hypothetical protein VFJ79_02540, partial [Acidimicrobiales bacterium]|nr:hypothetical protein [Acidimicrobiales bacterium]
MKSHFSNHYCYDRSHQHGAGDGYDNVIGWGAWHVQGVQQMLLGAAKLGHGLNPSFALTNEFLCPEPLVPFFEDFYDHASSAARVLVGDTRSLELRQSTADPNRELRQRTADPNDEFQARAVPVFQYVYSQQITAKMNIVEDDPVSHPGYRETRIGDPARPDEMLASSLDTTAIPDFPAWRQMAKAYCDQHYSEASLGVAPAYQIVRPDGTTGEYRYSRCLQDVINLRSRIFRFGMAGVWGERILLPATWIDGFYEYNEPAIEMALNAAHLQVRFNDYLRGGGSMLGPGQLLSGNTAISAWRVTWRTFDDAPDLRNALGGMTPIQDRRSRGTDADGRFAVRITTDKIQHMVWQKRTPQEIRNLYVFANVGNASATVQFHCVRGLESHSTWRRTIHTFVGYPSREETSPVGPLPNDKTDSVEVQPRSVVAVEIFA